MIHPLNQEHLLLEIFSHLDDPRDLLRCSRLNKLWNRVSENPMLWKSLCHKISLNSLFFDSWKTTYIKMGAISNGEWVCRKEISRKEAICLNDNLTLKVTAAYHNNLCAYLNSDCKVVLEDWVLDQQVRSFEIPEDAFNCTDELFRVRNNGDCILHLDNQSISLSILIQICDLYKKYTWKFAENDTFVTTEICGTNENLYSNISTKVSNNIDFRYIQKALLYKENLFVLILHSDCHLFGVWDEKNESILHLQSKESPSSPKNFLQAFITGDDLVIRDGNIVNSWKLDSYRKSEQFDLDASIGFWNVSSDFSGHLFYFLDLKDLMQICDSKGELLRKFKYSMIDSKVASIRTFATCMGKVCIEYATSESSDSLKIAIGEFIHFPKKGEVVITNSDK